MAKLKLIVPAIMLILLTRVIIGPVLLWLQMQTHSGNDQTNCGNGHPWLANADMATWWLSNGTAVPFEQACVGHDQCYNTPGMTRAKCDWMFLAEMQSGCRDTYAALPILSPLTHLGSLGCNIQAETYYIGVRFLPEVREAYCWEQYEAREGVYPSEEMMLTTCSGDQ